MTEADIEATIEDARLTIDEIRKNLLCSDETLLTATGRAHLIIALDSLSTAKQHLVLAGI